MNRLLLYISIFILFSQLSLVQSTSLTQYGSSFWCWYPCYCWYQFGTPFSGPVPKCWCWYPCGCWNRGFYNISGGAGYAATSARSATPTSGALSGGPTSGPTPTNAPPSGRP